MSFDLARVAEKNELTQDDPEVQNSQASSLALDHKVATALTKRSRGGQAKTPEHFNCSRLSIGFHKFSIGFRMFSIRFHRCSIGFHRFSIGFHMFSIGFHRFSIGFHRFSIGFIGFL